MQSRGKSTIIILLVLVLGIVLGSLGTGALRSRRMDRFKHMRPEDKFQEAIENIIKPDEKQSKELEILLEKYSQKIAEIHEKGNQELFSVMDSLRMEITTILTDEQLERFQNHMRESGEKFMNRHIDRLSEYLDLTEEQEEKIKSIFKRQDQLFFTKRPPFMDKSMIGMNAEKMKLDAEVEAVLTPEQKEKYKRLRLERKGGFIRMMFHERGMKQGKRFFNDKKK